MSVQVLSRKVVLEPTRPKMNALDKYYKTKLTIVKNGEQQVRAI